MNAPAKQSKAMSIVVATAGVIGALAGAAATRSLFSKPSTDEQLAKIAVEVNAKLPMTVDQFTRLDSVETQPGERLIYKYTITNLNPMPSPEEITATMRPMLVQNYQSAPEMKELRAMGVTLVYSYYDAGGQLLGEFEVKATDMM